MQQNQESNPQIEITFIKQSKFRQQIQNDNKLNLEILRILASKRQCQIQYATKMDQQQLCDYFDNYQILQQTAFTKQDLIHSKKLKLIRNNGKIYFGQVQSRQMSGRGICIYREGKIYQGTFYENKREGVGCQFYGNGNLYIGEFENNKKHGKGQFIWFNVNSSKQNQFYQYYDGQWWGGLPDGKGILQKVNGNIYEGFFKNGLKHGFGSQQFQNGDFYKGQYANGLPQGMGQYCWQDGSSYRGDFKQGLRSGFGCWKLNKNQNTQFYQGNYHMDKKNGYGNYSWGNGWHYKGNFDNDFREGYGELYNQKQCVFRGEWKKGIRVPKYDNDMVKISKVQIKQGKKQKQLNYVQISQICQDINKKINPSYKQYQLLARPGFVVRKQKGNLTQRYPKSNNKHEKDNLKQSRSTRASRVGTSISRPFLKANVIDSTKTLVSSRTYY